MSFFMKSKKKALRNIAFIAVGLFAASVVLGAGAGALGWLGGSEQAEKEVDEEALERQLAELERAVEENPEDTDALRNLGEYQLSLGSYYTQMEPDQEKADQYFDEAMETFEQLTDLEPENADIWVEKAMAAFQMHQMEVAQDSIEQVLDIDPEHLDGLNLQAHLFLYEGDYENAIENWEQLLDREDLTEQQEENFKNMIEQAQAMQAAEEGEEKIDIEEPNDEASDNDQENDTEEDDENNGDD